MKQNKCCRKGISLVHTTLWIYIATTLSGCQTLNNAGDNYGRTSLGCIGGTLLGAGIGAALNGKKGALTGGAIGLAAGCVAGYAWEQHEQELRKLAQEENMRINVERVYDQNVVSNVNNTVSAPSNTQPVGFVTQVGDEAMFNVGSAELTASGQSKFDKLATLFFQNRERNQQQAAPILVIGHTDATGDANFNRQLSELRAKKVIEILAARGIPRDRLYYQGAGSGRPLADNTTESGRALNRRVELVELQDDNMLAKRIDAENQNPRYIQHTASAKAKSLVSSQSAHFQQVASTKKKEKHIVTARSTSHAKKADATARNNGSLDFGGQPASDRWELVNSFTPDYSGGLGLISSAVASDAPLSSCMQDEPRVIGDVKNFAGKSVKAYKTSEYLSGMNGKVWAAKANGHVIYINPVSVLKQDTELTLQPSVELTANYNAGERNITGKYATVATTYKGKDNFLLRIFIQNDKAPMQCMDILLPYGGTKAQKGELYYYKNNQKFVADYLPYNTGTDL